jgi:hypothetical protein
MGLRCLFPFFSFLFFWFPFLLLARQNLNRETGGGRVGVLWVGKMSLSSQGFGLDPNNITPMRPGPLSIDAISPSLHDKWFLFFILFRPDSVLA